MPKKHLKTNTPNINIKVEHVDINQLRKASYNPRTRSESDEEQLHQSITRYGMIDPLIVNGHPKRKNIIIGGHFRFDMAQKMGFTTVPVVYVKIASIQKEKELNLRNYSQH
jgi:ParB-like chromosome segregation protein Spo0J